LSLPDSPKGVISALRDTGRVVALTGSGISAESGVPTFRELTFAPNVVLRVAATVTVVGFAVVVLLVVLPNSRRAYT
jgi:hypothetical protein